MQDCREEPWIEDTSFPLRLFLGGGLRKAELAHEILIDKLREVYLSVRNNKEVHLYMSSGGLIQTAYLPREALDEVGKEVAEFRAYPHPIDS